MDAAREGGDVSPTPRIDAAGSGHLYFCPRARCLASRRGHIRGRTRVSADANNEDDDQRPATRRPLGRWSNLRLLCPITSHLPSSAAVNNSYAARFLRAPEEGVERGRGSARSFRLEVNWDVERHLSWGGWIERFDSTPGLSSRVNKSKRFFYTNSKFCGEQIYNCR